MAGGVRCHLCGNTEGFTRRSDRLRYGIAKDVLECPSCGLVFLHPPITKEEEDRFYKEEYGAIFAKEKDSTPESLFAARGPEAKEYHRLCAPYLTPHDDCLEVGCASGYFLHFLRDKVRMVTGFETFPDFRTFCDTMKIPLLEDLDSPPDASYDRIFMFFLLEHLADPAPYLSNLRRLLRPGGCLFVIVPNVEDALISLYGAEGFRRFYYTLAHPYYYSRATLAKVLAQGGFPDVEIHPHHRYDLSNHIHWMLEAKPGGKGRFSAVFSPALEKEYAEALKAKFLCDTLFAVARKPS